MTDSDSSPSIPLGYCQCGCGRKTNIAPKSSLKLGHVKGKPYAYVVGHVNGRVPDNYRVTDTGYETPCWVWNGKTNAGGYAPLYRKQYGGYTMAHRVFYERVHGHVPRSIDIHHLCKVRNCVNPAHLRAMTRVEHFRLEQGRITLEVAESIRREYAAGGISQRAIAARYSISQQLVSSIVQRKRWT